MSINKFGHFIGGNGRRGPPGEGFKRTNDGDYDMQNRLLRNVAPPIKKTDAATLEVVDSKCSSLEESLWLRIKSMIEAEIRKHNDCCVTMDDRLKELEKTPSNNC